MGSRLGGVLVAPYSLWYEWPTHHITVPVCGRVNAACSSGLEPGVPASGL